MARERPQQPAVEIETRPEIADDEIEVVDAVHGHAIPIARLPRGRTYLRDHLLTKRYRVAVMFWLGNKIWHGLKSLWVKLRGGVKDTPAS